MANFVKHEPCPNCGSRNNLARYDDGSAYCFGCHYVEKGTINEATFKSPAPKDTDALQDLLKRATIDFLPEHVGWLGQYEINVSTAVLNGFRAIRGSTDLAMFFSEDDDPPVQIVGAQVRHFGNNKRKYTTYGNLEHHYPIYWNQDTHFKSLVLVEDVVSAIKCSYYTDAMPCLTSMLSTSKIAEVARLYKQVFIWLDSNMLHNAHKMSSRFDSLGVKSSVIYTPKDPKEYSWEEIRCFLTTGVDST